MIPHEGSSARSPRSPGISRRRTWARRPSGPIWSRGTVCPTRCHDRPTGDAYT